MKQFSWSAFACLFLGAAAYAQDSRANILGQVVDSSGLAIPNATVTATKEDTNVSRDTVTNAEGVYTLVGLDPGRYTVAIKGKRIHHGSPVRYSVAGRRESEPVHQHGLVFDPTKMEELPLPGRTVFMLMQFTPGVMFRGALPMK